MHFLLILRIGEVIIDFFFTSLILCTNANEEDEDYFLDNDRSIQLETSKNAASLNCSTNNDKLLNHTKANANFLKGHKNVVKMLIYAWLARADMSDPYPY